MIERISVLLTTHNRFKVTDAFLCSLDAQETAAAFTIYLVDSSSADGTAAFVRANHPGVRVIDADANVFWCAGMRMAFAAAQTADHDFVLWANDDTLLEPDAVQRLLDTHAQMARTKGHDRIVVCGGFHDETGQPTYGGVRRKPGLRLTFERVAPDDEPEQVDTMNGNLVLVPASVARAVGNFDPAFQHSLGDFDYGLRTVAAGGEVWVAGGSAGRCSHNDRAGSWQDDSLPFAERIRKVRRPTGLPPRDWALFTRRHAGRWWLLNWASPYVKLVLSSMLAANRRRTT